MSGHHHHHDQQQPARAPHGGAPYPPIYLQGDTVKIYCEANPDYHLANLNGHVVMRVANDSDPNQQWIMDTSWSVRAKDDAGFPAFALINRATGQALRHGRSESERVTLGPYHLDDLNEAVLFTQSADVGRGYQCIRPVNNIHFNLEAMFEDDKHHHGFREGVEVVLFKWNKKENQKWKISPILSSSYRASGYGSLYPQLSIEEPRGTAIRIYCEANPDFFMAARGHLAVLALGSPHDPHQQWIKVDSWGLKVKDEIGFPAFALVNKATKQALKHGNKEWEQICLADYNHYKLDESVLWTQSADIGHGYQCLRPVNNIHLNLDAKGANGETGGIHHGNELILFSWNNQSNQKWKMQPLLSSSHGAYGHGPLYPRHSEEEAWGTVIRVYCEANPAFFMAAQGHLAVLALGSPHDPHQHWIKVDSWSLKVKDEAGFPAFALVNKATKQALKHGNQKWGQIYLADYNRYKLDESFLWTQSADVGDGYQCLRPANNIHLNLDAKRADGETVRIYHGNELILFGWNNQSNQKWKLRPL